MAQKLNLKAVRINVGLTQEELAKKLNITPQTLSSWENYETNIPAKQLKKLCEICKADMNQIFLE